MKYGFTVKPYSCKAVAVYTVRYGIATELRFRKEYKSRFRKKSRSTEKV